MDAIIAYLRKLVGLELTIDSVTARQSKVVRDLDKLETIYKGKCDKATKRAQKAAKAAELARQEADEAAKLSSNWKNSGLVRTPRSANTNAEVSKTEADVEAA
ncbi:hypothetical protein [Agrobacterium sp. CG674]